MKKPQTLPPDPARLVEGLRDTGYDFNMALADITDNSLDADASTISVNIAMDLGGEISVWVADDGYGMNEAELENAMKYGSESKKDPSSLGKFGLGLKTASTAFCRKFSVVSRAKDTDPYLKAVWDLDHVVNKHEWELLWEDPSKEEIAILDNMIHRVVNSHGKQLIK